MFLTKDQRLEASDCDSGVTRADGAEEAGRCAALAAMTGWDASRDYQWRAAEERDREVRAEAVTRCATLSCVPL